MTWRLSVMEQAALLSGPLHGGLCGVPSPIPMRSLHWFRKGLRLHDNPALVEACREAHAVYPVFILDPHFAKPEYVGVNRYAFLLESLQDLDTQLRQLGSRLFVVQGKPLSQLEHLFQEWSIDTLTFEADTEPYALKRDKEVRALADKHNVSVSIHHSHTLHDLNIYGDVPKSYNSFLSVFRSKGDVELCTSNISDLLPALDKGLVALKDHTVPSLEKMGYPASSQPLRFPGGETEGLRRLERYIADKRFITTFEKPKTSPNSLEPSTTVLSPYLKFGCVSPRSFWHRLCSVLNTSSSHTSPPVSLQGQMLFREWFYLNGYKIPHFDQMEGNPLCRQIDWNEDKELLQAWEEGRTGYPWIDAIMNQLRTEGWIHHLARHATACFLTRGDLWQSWTAGARVFERYLLDADWSLNNANWMWLSCSAFFHQYFRVYSPISFGKKTDKTGEFIRKYVPALEQVPDKFIYEPWKMPHMMQEKIGCVIGKDYPERIVLHEEACPNNKNRMAAAFEANKRASAKRQKI